MLLRLVKGQRHQIRRLLHRGRRVHQTAVVPVSPVLDHLKVVPLGLENIPKSGAVAHHVHDHTGQLRRGDIGDSLLQKAEPGSRRAGHGPKPCGSGPVHHGNAGNLRLRLHKCAAHLRQAFGEVLQYLSLGRDRIAGEKPHPGPHRGLRNGVVSFH